MVYLKLNFLLVFIPQCCFLLKETVKIVCPHYLAVLQREKSFLNDFLIQILRSDIFWTNKAKKLSSLMVSGDDGWYSCSLTVLTKRVDFTKISFFKHLIKDSRRDFNIFIKAGIDRVFDALHFGIFFVKIWST